MQRHTVQTDPRRILIVKPSAIGDVVHTLPILNLLRTRYPQAKISWLLTPACAGLLEGHPQLDEVILFDRKHLGRSWWTPTGARDYLKLHKALRDREFDLVIDLQGLLRSGAISWQTGARERVGFAAAREAAWLFYTRRVEVGPPEQHAIDRYLAIADAVGCGESPVKYVFATTDDDREHVRLKLGRIGPYAVLLPGTNWPTKRWPAKGFADLVGPLKHRWGLASVVAGGPDAAELAETIGGIDLTNQTSLNQLVALLEHAAVVVANDSGPMHIAAALGRPLVVAFGPTNPIRTGPHRRPLSVVRLDLPCSPCYSRTCVHHTCMASLEPGSVLERIGQELARADERRA